MSREILQIDSIKWLKEFSSSSSLLSGDIFTSIPDITELKDIYPSYSKENLHLYKEWFEETSYLLFLRANKCAIFLQSDCRIINQQSKEIMEFIDKSSLISNAAKKANFKLVWHKICFNSTSSSSPLPSPSSSTISSTTTTPIIQKKEDFNIKVIRDRPNWSHLLCYIRREEGGEEEERIIYKCNEWATPDIFPRGEMIWSRAIGLNCAIIGISFLKQICQTRCVIDPFCGHGTVLAVANAVGLNSFGCEISRKRCRKASQLNLLNNLELLGYRHCRMYGLYQQIIKENEKEKEVENRNIDREDIQQIENYKVENDDRYENNSNDDESEDEV